MLEYISANLHNVLSRFKLKSISHLSLRKVHSSPPKQASISKKMDLLVLNVR